MISVRFVTVLYKTLLKCHVTIYVVCPVQMVGLKTTTHVPCAGSKLVPISKSKSAEDAGTVQNKR